MQNKLLILNELFNKSYTYVGGKVKWLKCGPMIPMIAIPSTAKSPLMYLQILSTLSSWHILCSYYYHIGITIVVSYFVVLLLRNLSRTIGSAVYASGTSHSPYRAGVTNFFYGGPFSNLSNFGWSQQFQ